MKTSSKGFKYESKYQEECTEAIRDSVRSYIEKLDRVDSCLDILYVYKNVFGVNMKGDDFFGDFDFKGVNYDFIMMDVRYYCNKYRDRERDHFRVFEFPDGVEHDAIGFRTYIDNCIEAYETKRPYPFRIVKCVDCGNEFSMTRSEVNWYISGHMNLPRRCRECRKLKKRYNER